MEYILIWCFGYYIFWIGLLASYTDNGGSALEWLQLGFGITISLFMLLSCVYYII